MQPPATRDGGERDPKRVPLTEQHAAPIAAVATSVVGDTTLCLHPATVENPSTGPGGPVLASTGGTGPTG